MLLGAQNASLKSEKLSRLCNCIISAHKGEAEHGVKEVASNKIMWGHIMDTSFGSSDYRLSTFSATLKRTFSSSFHTKYILRPLFDVRNATPPTVLKLGP